MNAETSSSPAFKNASPQEGPQEILLDMMRITDELVHIHGGTWAYEGNLPFDPSNTSGYWGMTTCGDDISRQYSDSLLIGPRVSRPEDAAATAAEHFATQGFTETNKFKSSFGDNQYVVQTLTHPNGAALIYQPGTEHSSIEVHSACSSDPGMDMRTL